MTASFEHFRGNSSTYIQVLTGTFIFIVLFFNPRFIACILFKYQYLFAIFWSKEFQPMIPPLIFVSCGSFKLSDVSIWHSTLSLPVSLPPIEYVIACFIITLHVLFSLFKKFFQQPGQHLKAYSNEGYLNMKQMNKYVLGKITYRYDKENQSRHMFVVQKACLSKCTGEDLYGSRKNGCTEGYCLVVT